MEKLVTDNRKTIVMTTKIFRKRFLILIYVFILIAYAPHIGRILHSDDFFRIQDSSVLDKAYFKTLLFDNRSDSFYRPLNHLSFGITYYFFGLHALPYGLFNLFLLLGSVFLLFRILMILFRSSVFASLVTFSWLLNIKLVYIVLLWAVGRTTGLYVFFLLLAAYFTLKAQKSHSIFWLTLTVLGTFLSILSKESAVVGPILILLLVFSQLIQKESFRGKQLLWLAIAFILVYWSYFYLRSISHAMTPETAPSFYKLTFSPQDIVYHLYSYIERSLTLSALLIPAFYLKKWRLHQQRRIIGKRLLWYHSVSIGFLLFCISIAPMVVISTKSNLYAFFPSIFVVGVMVSLLIYNRRWPCRRHDLKEILIMMIVLGVIITPIAWEQELGWIHRNEHIYKWSWTIYNHIKEHKPSEIVLLHNPDLVELKQKDFIYLDIGLSLLMQQHVSIVNNPQPQKNNEWTFEIIPEIDSERKGKIRYIKTKQ